MGSSHGRLCVPLDGCPQEAASLRNDKTPSPLHVLECGWKSPKRGGFLILKKRWSSSAFHLGLFVDSPLTLIKQLQDLGVASKCLHKKSKCVYAVAVSFF